VVTGLTGFHLKMSKNGSNIDEYWVNCLLGGLKKMGVEKKVVGTKISKEKYAKLEEIAAKNGQTVASLALICLEGVLSGEIEILGGEIKVGEHEIYGSNDEILEDESEYRKYGYEKMTRMFLKKKYPEGTIKDIVETIVSQIEEGPNYNPRRQADWC
jgi:hypothetical protein